MKNIKYAILTLFMLSVVVACQDEDQEFGEIISPTNIQITADIVGADANNPNGDGSGVVNFSATADNVTSFRFIYDGNTTVSTSGRTTISFATLGLNKYTVTVVASGAAGLTSTKTIEVEVLSTYSPPQELLDKLHGGTQKEWRVLASKPGHFGLGPVGGTVPVEWYGAAPNEKATVGMYDDRYIFSADGTFKHITNAENDTPTEDPTGTVFGRDPFITELGPLTGTVNGADIENFEYSDYTESYTITAPGGQETINLTGLAFIGYYTGGSHTYQIFDRSVPNELLIKTTDGNGEFDWWITLTSN